MGLVALLFIHEMGHAVVMKLKGIPVGAMIFIPMMGAAVVMRQMPQNARDEAEVGIAGPIAGTIASSFCLFMGMLPGASLIWAALAYFGFFLNLFNLVPIVPFDGGRVLAAIDRRVWWLGFVALLGFFIWTWINGNFSIFLLLFVLMAGSQFWSRRGTANLPGAQWASYAGMAYNVGAIAGYIGLGFFADRYGRRPVTIAYVVIAFITSALVLRREAVTVVHGPCDAAGWAVVL